MDKTVIYRNSKYRDIIYKDGRQQHANKIHLHKEWSISYVVSGSTNVKVGRENYMLKAGEFIVIPPNIPHLCSPGKSEDFYFGVLYIPFQFITDSGEDIFSRCFAGSCSYDDIKSISDLFINAESKNVIKSSITELVQLLARSVFSSFNVTSAEIPLNEEQEDVPISDSSSSRYQQYYRSRNKYGIGHKNIQTINRIENAKELLFNGNSDLAEISLDCGFYDQSHFTKTFKQFTGLTPQQYKN